MMAYFREHPALLAVCFCLFLTLFVVDKIHSEAQNFHIVQALDDLKESLGKDEDVMKETWCHKDTDGLKRTIVVEVSQLSGESAADTSARFDALYDLMIAKRPRNCE